MAPQRHYMKLASKISFGLGFLFLIIFTLCIFSSFYIQKLSGEANNILKDNFNSLIYAKNMLVVQDDLRNEMDKTMVRALQNNRSEQSERLVLDSLKQTFSHSLQMEKDNITEVHEKDLVETLSSDYAEFISAYGRLIKDSNQTAAGYEEYVQAYKKMKRSINAIYDLNLQAMTRKGQLTFRDSQRFNNYMGIIGALCTIIAFGYFWYFPFYVSHSLSILSGRMKQLLLNHNISLNTQSTDEARILLHGIGALNQKLSERKK
jgi:hypothetical protein